MLAYIKTFDQMSQYDEFTGTTGFIKPNLSVIAKEREVKYTPLIPKGYTRLEWIENNTTGNTDGAYINTQYLLDFTETIQGKVSVSNYKTPYGGVVGNYKAEASNCTRIIQKNSDPTHVFMYYNVKAGGGATEASVGGLNIPYTYSFDSSAYTINGVSYDINRTTGEPFNANILIFTNHPGYAIVNCKYYWFKILGHVHMLPVINPQGVVGMYDTIRERFFTSETSTPFIAGPKMII